MEVSVTRYCFVCLLSLACLVSAGCSRAEQMDQPPAQAEPAPAPAVAVPSLPAKVPPLGKSTLGPLLKRVTPGVVSIAVSGKVAVQQNPLLQDPFFRRFFGIPPGPVERKFQAAGSGVIVDAEKGYILTNNHVAQHADEITAVLSDGRRLEAKLVGTDPQSDIAVIKVEAKNLTGLPMGNSDAVEVGDFVVAIGNPFGLSETATFGIVSALGRSGLGIEGYEDFIQTDASINPGNSGGPLLDLEGNVIGINSAIVGPAGGNVGIGFAIPSNMAREVMDQIVRYGKVRRGQLGILIQDLTPELAKALGVDAKAGAVVSKVVPRSAAAKAGIESGDVIVAIDGAAVSNAVSLRNQIGVREMGSKVTLDVLRDGKRRSVEVTIAPFEQEKVAGKSLSPLLDGASFGEIGPNDPDYGRVAGVAVVDVRRGSPAWDGGLRPGDVVTSVDRVLVGSVATLRDALAERPGAMLLHVLRDDEALFLSID
jgi:Do/DeqQ family serine protease